MGNVSRSAWLRFGVAILSFVVATLLRMSLRPVLGSDFPYIIYLIAIIFTAWYGGLWPALLATLLGMFGAVYFFIPPQYHFNGPASLIGLSLFAITGVTSGFLSEAMHKSQVRVVKTTAALNKAQERFRGIYESSLDSIVYANLDGRFADFNRAFERLTGYTRAELLNGMHYDDLTPEEYREKGREFIERMLKTGEPQEYEKEYFRKDGTRVSVALSIFLVQDGNGKPAGMAAIVKDITERKKIEAEIAEQTEVVETVNRLGQVLAAELDLQKLVQAVTDAATELTGAHFGAFFYNVLDERGASYMLYTLSGVPREAFKHFPMPRATDLFGPTFRGEGTIRIDDVHKDPRYGKNSPYYGMPPGHLPVTSYLAVPVILRSGEVLGGLFFGHPQAAIFSERDERIVEGLAAQSAVAMDNARLFETAQRARERAEASEKRSAFLAAASEALASSLDYETTLASVARLAVPHIADWCAVHMFDHDKEIKQLALAHVDPSKVEMAQELRDRFPTRSDDSVGVAKVMRTGQPEIYAEITSDLIKSTAQSQEHARIVLELGLKSAMIVPMIAHGQVLGAITLISTQANRRYGAEDLALAEDLARRAALAIDNARLYREAREANRIKDEFLATVSHELRTPLTPILGWTHLLSRNSDEETMTRGLQTIERNAKAQEQIINDLLDVSRIITGKLRFDIRPIELEPVIESAIEAVRPAAEAKSIHLESDLKTEPFQVPADPDRLQQVVWNLLTNAIKFTPTNGRVSIRLERQNSHARIIVSDTGQGITQDFLPFVFDRFRQADSSTTRLHGGLGLGLAIVRHLVEMHGGTVGVESHGAGKGTTFTVSLPIPLQFGSALAQEVERRQRAPLGKVAVSLAGLVKLEGVRVLIVDDQPDTLEMLTLILNQCGANVLAARSTAEGIRLLKEQRPDVLVSDIEMPGEDGYELIKQVRALEAQHGGQTPAVALTAYARTEDRIRALSSGFQIHVPKPVEPVELAMVIANLAERS